MAQMIQYHYQTDFKISDPEKYTSWIESVVHSRGSDVAELHYVFCSDEALLEINQDHLGHDYYTDIITFPYGSPESISADIFISVDRVFDNAVHLQILAEEEMRRVMIHGVLHLLGMNDKTDQEIREMRSSEDRALEMFHVKHQ